MLANDPDGCKLLICRIVELAVRDAGASDPELAGEARHWLNGGGGLDWACSWLRMDADDLRRRIAAEALSDCDYQPELAGLGTVL